MRASAATQTPVMRVMEGVGGAVVGVLVAIKLLKMLKDDDKTDQS